MEIFYSNDCDGDVCRLDAEESNHCLRVLRYRIGDEIFTVDGKGTLYRCELTGDAPKEVVAQVLEALPGWGGHPYSLNMAVCPTKNNERFEWFVEKATELGVDVISPVFGERSERRVFKTDRSRKIALSAMKQSLKAKRPLIEEPVSVRDFIRARRSDSALKTIAYCFEGETERRSIAEALGSLRLDPTGSAAPKTELVILIGPEGDFSPEEARLAVDHGFIPIHLGPSHLRTETAAVIAVAACYLALQE
jgi:16S rRNA (uracil1498-N3)-methyltransferase